MTDIYTIKNIFNNHFDRNDLVLHYESDFSIDDFDSDGFSTRVDDSILVIRSIKELEAKNLKEFAYNLCIQTTLEYNHEEPLKGVIAIIGKEDNRDRFGRVISDDIKELLSEAEMIDSKNFLSWAKYEGMCVVSQHPEVNIENFI